MLVGHSFGGFDARLFAVYYPAETAGLVLVDSSHEHQVERFEDGSIRMNTAPRTGFFVLSAPSIPSNLPADLQPIARQLAVRSSAQLAARAELAAFRESAEELASAGPLPDVPLTVVTRGRRVWPRTAKGDAMEKLWMELQDDLAARSPHAIHMIAERSGHYVQLDQPEVVLNAIRVTVEAVRKASMPRN